ncbi:rho GTPase-activating protein 20-like isoform X2 [Ischnura elegans]|uniref:rho GTPase-activating protein 20-like isoform X2 n=1 Tax=Ischnura elegans TaxID=197161 RepID=UPI001ED88578|nr:rho GTPase-activating protein 20-like isoform X2 [Ischnura elegans]
MLGQWVTRLHGLAPRPRRRRHFREVQSEPESGDEAPTPPRPPPPLAASKSLGRLDGLREVQRLAQYEAGGSGGWAAIDAPSPATRAAAHRELQSDLERIQNLFPNDALCLYEKDVSHVVSRAGKSTPRRRSSSSRASGTHATGRRFIMESPVQFTTGLQSQERHMFLFNDLLLVAKARSAGHFKLKERVRISDAWLSLGPIDDLSEVPCSPDTSFIVGWPTTNIVATFSTKAARDQWLSVLSEVIAVERDKEPPSTNIQVVYYNLSTHVEYCKTFSVRPTDTARHCIRLALEHLGPEAVSLEENLDDLVGAFQLWAKSASDKGNEGESPYPLLGHERPFAIKLHCLRLALSTEEGFDLEHCNNLYGTDPLTRCQFLLRNKSTSVIVSSLDGKMTLKKKSRKSPIRIHQVFRRSISSKADERLENRISNASSSEQDHAASLLFGVPLSRLIRNQIPKSVQGMLFQVFLKGPSTQGIFRKSANVRLVRELREKLDRGRDIDLNHIPVLTTAALLKEFLRSLPDPLLCAHLFPDWISALATQDISEKIGRLKSVLDMLPAANSLLLQHFLCVLHHISARSGENLMSSVNLGVCVGPSLLWVPSLTPSSSRTVPALVTLLIDHCEALCGPHVVSLLGEPPERDAARLDSGAEESDSLHSGGGLRRDDSSIDSLERELLESSPPPRKDKMSLSRDSGLTMSDTQLYTPDEEDTSSTSGSGSGVGRVVHQRSSPSSYPVNSPLMSTPPSIGPYHSKVMASLSTPSPFGAVGEKSRFMMNMLPEPKKYVRVYAGWDERMECFRKGCGDSVYGKRISRHAQPPSGPHQVLNPNFQRQDWFRQRSQLKRVASKQSGHTSSGSSTSSSGGGGTSSGKDVSERALRRSASDESLPRAAFTLEQGANRKGPTVDAKGAFPAPSRRHPWALHSRRHTTHHAYLAPSTFLPLPHSAPVPIPRSRSAHHLVADDWRAHGGVRSATSGGEDLDSSTLSDDDSTPHVSRSNSRGKDCPAPEDLHAAMRLTKALPSYEEAMTRRPQVVRAAPATTVPDQGADSDAESLPPPPPPRRGSGEQRGEARRARPGRRGRRGSAQRSQSLPPGAAGGGKPQGCSAPPLYGGCGGPPPYRHPPSCPPVTRSRPRDHAIVLGEEEESYV